MGAKSPVRELHLSNADLRTGELLAATFDKAKPVAIRSVWPISPGKGFDAPSRLVYIH